MPRRAAELPFPFLLPELFGKLERDGKIVLDDDSINIFKVCSHGSTVATLFRLLLGHPLTCGGPQIAIDPVWHLPSLASKLGVELPELRDKLAKWTQVNISRSTCAPRGDWG